MIDMRSTKVCMTILFVAMCMLSCGENNEQKRSSRPDAELADAESADDTSPDVEEVSGCESGSDAGRVDTGVTECRDGQVFDCAEGGWEATMRVCNGPHADIRILDELDLGFVEEGIGGAYISMSYQVRNSGDVATENLRCELEVLDRNGDSLGFQSVFITTGEIDGPGVERLGTEFGGLEEDAFPSVRLFCTADNEPTPFVDEKNLFTAVVRQF
jgi:hypothetical protein